MVLLLVLLGLTFPVLGQEPLVGTVKVARGSSVVRRGANSTPVREGMRLLLSDTLQTSADGHLGLILEDSTRISLGPNTDLRLDRFAYQPAEGKFDLLLRLGRGVLAYVSGRIAQFSPQSVRLETPVAIIGLRGTSFAISIEGP